LAENIALVAGATGAVGDRIVDVLAETPGWQVVGLCRNPPEEKRPNVRFIRTDLTSPESCRAAVAQAHEQVGAITHFAYCSRAPFKEGGVEDVPGNLTMFANALDAADVPSLRHAHLVAGSKWYGMHIGPYRTPAEEGDARHMPPNFYYDQQDYLTTKRAGKAWSWSSSRPAVIVDVAPGRGRNIVSTIGAYAAICRETGAAFDFIGKQGAYDTLLEVTGSRLLASSIRWMFTDPRAADQAFNITNGDVFRWSRLWPILARHLGVECGIVRRSSMQFWVGDKGEVWDRIVEKHQLRKFRMDEVSSWNFADFVFGMDYDVMSSLNRCRLAGFHDTIDTTAMFLRYLDAYKAERVLP